MEKEAEEKTSQDSSPTSSAGTVIAYTSSTKRIAKNTLMLYFRQILIMLVSLYTVRVVLATLGAEDYGIYNVVAGVVVMFGFINSALATTCQRFLSFEIGMRHYEKVRTIFSQFFFIMLVMAFAISIFTEIGGMWFIQNKMQLPEGRRTTAKVALHFSVAVTFFNTIRIPYNALIISFERMNFFAAVSIVESVLKLLVVFALRGFQFDKLILYAVLLFFVSMIVFACYVLFCFVNFSEIRVNFCFEKKSINEMLSFSWWSLFGGFASMANNQGMNLIINVFCGVVVNAALGIANQVYNAVYQFVTNFQTAFNPQIVKVYALGNRNELFSMINRTAKYSYYLLLFIVVPLFVNLEFVLNLWLDEYPENTMIFIKLLLLEALASPLNGPFWMTVQASGKIAKYQLFTSLIIILNVPISFFLLKNGFAPCSVLIVKIILQIVITVYRVIYLSKKEGFLLGVFLKEVVFPAIPISFVSFILVFIVNVCFRQRIASFFASCLFSVLLVPLLVFLFGSTKGEKNKIYKVISIKIFRGKNGC